MKLKIDDVKPVFIAWTNTDLTEGRGGAIPLAVCDLQATAIRLGRKGSVQGCDCDIGQSNAVLIQGLWLAPCRIIPPTQEDLATEKSINDKLAAIKKAQQLGLTMSDIKAIQAP